MPRNKVLEKAKVTMPSGRNAVDLSQEKSFAQLASDLNVCYVQPCVAGTSGQISRKCFTRTADVVSPAFHRISEHFDFFVVPIHALWRYWENWKLNINDMQDTNLVPFSTTPNNPSPDLALPSNTPRLDHASLIKNLGYYLLNDGATIAGNARKANDVLRLLEQLRYGSCEQAIKTSGAVTTVLNLFKAAAYQKVYFDHYRNTAYESNNPYAYNLDWLTADSNHNGLLSPTAPADASTPPSKDTYVAQELFKIRRVNYRNDYYHNLYPALNYVASTPAGSNWSIPSVIGGVTGSSSTNQFSVLSYSGPFSPSLNQDKAYLQAYNQNISVQSIRALFALDKLMRASAYAPKRVRDQYKALYGIDGVEDFDMKSERIGSFQSDVVLTEVTQMVNNSDSEVSNLGALGAKGLGGDSKSETLKYHCKYDSIIIGIHYFLPRARYDAFGVDPWNTNITRESFYVKAFENLGLRPMYVSCLDNRSSYRAQMIGWTVPNFVYKILPDLNEGPFKEQFCEIIDNESAYYSDETHTSELSTYVPHCNNRHISEVLYNQAEYFKSSPEDLNNLFALEVPSDHRIGFYQFFGDFRITNAAVIPMSIHGQPSL